MKSDNNYDVIIVGSGFGGSFAAYSLAKAGLKTLLLEKGHWVGRDEPDWNPQVILFNKRYKSSSPILVKQYKSKNFRKLHPIEAVGGMSLFFGGACLRMRETDFEKWPIDYTDLERYYTQAEKLLEVYGEPENDACDPFRSENCLVGGIGLTRPARRIYRAADELGYEPFKLPVAINFRNESRPVCTSCNSCDGFFCSIGAKNDLTTTVLSQAQCLGLEIMSGVLVKRVVEENGEIKSVECINTTTEEGFNLSPRIVIVSGGAIQSPALLLRSNLQRHKNHRFIGKYLMRHCNAVVCALFPFKVNPEKVFHKQVCTTAFYEDLREELSTCVGIIQSIYTPSPDAMTDFAPWGLKNAVARMSEHVQNLVCIAEDSPAIHNCVTLSDQLDAHGLPIVKVEHRYDKNDRRRLNYLIKRAKKILKKAGGLLAFSLNVRTFSHAVGTVRFGDSPEKSVLDRHCRFFGIKNLFVLDGSFMPTSAGVNPCLTIGANSLRVADYIVSDFDRLVALG
jgi:choline dehydrogenase-like flavoprotein